MARSSTSASPAVPRPTVRSGRVWTAVHALHTQTIYQSDISVQPLRPGRASRPDCEKAAPPHRERAGERRTAMPTRISLGQVSSRPGALDGVQTSPTGGRVEYRLARNAVVSEF